MRSSFIAAALTLGLAGCGSPGAQNQGEATPTAGNEAGAGMNETGGTSQRAMATLQTAQGAAAGSVTASAADGGVRVALNVEGLPPGEHGAHVHTTGRCDAPAFESAGGHWNPTNAQHGLEDPDGQHAGDMPNLTVGPDGRGTLEYALLGGSFEGLLDGDGSALVIHASADDQRTDPSGDSGDRIACGVFQPG